MGQVDDQENVPDTFDDLPEEPEEKTETVTRRTVYRTAVLPADKPKEGDEDEVKDKEPEEVVTLQDDGTVVRKTITIRKRIIRKIIVLPDGTRKEVEEEQPVEEVPAGEEPTGEEPSVDYVDVTRR